MSIDSDTLNYLNEDEGTQEDSVEGEKQLGDSAFLEGICSRCIDSGFVHTTKDGVLGVAYRIEGADSVGNPIKRLLICNHGSVQRY